MATSTSKKLFSDLISLPGYLTRRSTLAVAGLSLIASPLYRTMAMPSTGHEGHFSTADEAEYTRRFQQFLDTSRTTGGTAEYDPLEAVRGASLPKPLPVKVRTTLSSKALAAADDYAAIRNSSALIIWRGGAIERERYYGTTGRDTPIVSKSLAKPVTALLIGRALKQGYIKSLDQPVADFITEWKGDARREKMLIRHLLDMRTGFLPQNFSTSGDDILNRAYLHPRHDAVIIRDYPLTDEPGTIYEYSNATSELIAPVIERATGKRYGTYLTEALLAPIGAAGGSVWVNHEGGTAHSGCCLILPAQSWLRMAILILRDGVWQGKRLLPAGYVTQMRTGTAQNPYYGMGLWLAGRYVERRGFANQTRKVGQVLHAEPYADKDLFLFDGNANQVAYMIPSKDMVILRVGANPPKDKEWDNSYLPNLLIRDDDRRRGSPPPAPQPK